MVLTRAYDDEILVFPVDFLLLPNTFESDKVHSMFIGPEDTLCLNRYSHDLKECLVGLNLRPPIRKILRNISMNKTGTLAIAFLNFLSTR